MTWGVPRDVSFVWIGWLYLKGPWVAFWLEHVMDSLSNTAYHTKFELHICAVL